LIRTAAARFRLESWPGSTSLLSEALDARLLSLPVFPASALEESDSFLFSLFFSSRAPVLPDWHFMDSNTGRIFVRTAHRNFAVTASMDHFHTSPSAVTASAA
jgi:hypothetical protein